MLQNCALFVRLIRGSNQNLALLHLLWLCFWFCFPFLFLIFFWSAIIWPSCLMFLSSSPILQVLFEFWIYIIILLPRKKKLSSQGKKERKESYPIHVTPADTEFGKELDVGNLKPTIGDLIYFHDSKTYDFFLQNLSLDHTFTFWIFLVEINQ